MPTFREAAKLTKSYILHALCSPYLALLNRRRWRLKRPTRRRSTHMKGPYLTPLPTDRIDILNQSRPMVAQPSTCRLLRLPPELRELIFEIAVGNRLVHIKRVPVGYDGRSIYASFYVRPEKPDTPNSLRMLDPADDIPVALLLVCRAVYVEVFPIILRQNTFFFCLRDFPHIIQCGLGQYCLTELRSIHLGKDDWSSPSWDVAFKILHRMRLDSLALEFDANAAAYLTPVSFANENCRRLLAIRHLRNLDIFFLEPHPHAVHPESDQITKAFRDLMIGPEADEKYEAFLLAGSTTAESATPLLDSGARWAPAI
ncbi:hypothetical protein DFH08DRAFT_900200 [Mycena albidolilacea]|uniref:DUF7730 domain-containing protein n=1 Tax=Mycena albidolilacea TaxID=1033008 RepID=A0AAD6Z5P0_9AGAR|nr:hypothetical protein DFH08DRAFT_900200 [Mycena albidolilacea]